MTKIENIPIHLTLEGWIHYLLLNGFLSQNDLDELVFLPVGVLTRNYSSEIERFDITSNPNENGFPYYSNSEDNENEIFWIHRNGFYHKLPYFLFHSFNTTESDFSLNKKIESERGELINAMKHLLPLDNEFFRQKLVFFHEIKRYASQPIINHFEGIFSWKLNWMRQKYDFMGDLLPKFFLRLFSFKDTIAQDFDFFRLGLSQILAEFFSKLEERGINFSIDFINKKHYSRSFKIHNDYLLDWEFESRYQSKNFFHNITLAPQLNTPQLGKSRLGVNASCGIPFPDEQFVEINFKIKSRHQIKYFIDFKEKSILIALFEMYFDFFSPLNRRFLCPIKVEVLEEVQAFLSESATPPFSNILGYGIRI